MEIKGLRGGGGGGWSMRWLEENNYRANQNEFFQQKSNFSITLIFGCSITEQ